MVIPIATGTLGKIPKRLLKGQKELELRGQVRTTQTTILLRSARTRRLKETYCHLNSIKNPSAKAGVKISQRRIIIIIIIIMSCRQHGYPWPSLATSLYHSSLLAGLQGNIPYPQIAAVFIFEPVVRLLLGHMRGSIGEHHWWVRLCLSSSGNLLSFLLRCGTRPYERGTQWDSNSLVWVC